MIKIFKVNNITGLLAILLIGISVFNIAIIQPASAQTPDEPWTPPVNLSHSGATTNPSIVMDSNRIVHVIWEDEFAGWIYTRLEGDTWSVPVAVEVPFDDLLESEESSRLWLVSDANGRIHAFWTDQENGLFYSVVQADLFNDVSAWGAPLQLAQSALDIDVEIDSRGSMHLVYVRAVGDAVFPAGIYYRSLAAGGIEWSDPDVLYQSQYFRSLNVEDANVEIATADFAGVPNLYVAWDNRPRKRIYQMKSSNGGETWGESVELASPDSSSGLGMPFNIQIFSAGGDVLRTWQLGETEFSCTQYYQWSMNGGDTWSEEQVMFEDLGSCPQDSHLFTDDAGLILFMTMVENQIYLLAWDGAQWSESQLQRELYAFEDPETYTQVIYRCRQPEFTEQSQLLMVGCDQGEGGDIWFTSHSVGTVDDWFPPPSIWSHPIPIAASISEISSPVLVADDDMKMHALWSQAEQGSENAEDTFIHYSHWDGESWSSPIAVLRSPSGVAENPAVDLDYNGRLLVVWNDDYPGEIYFSWADSDQVTSALDWADPQVLPSVRAGGSMPDILADRDKIIVVYAIPVNEQRGIYLTSSEDGGETWNEPIQVFDGVAEEWEMVSEPHLARSRDGKLHVIWTRRTLPGGEGPLSLSYAMSEDGGITWTEADLVMEGPVEWSEVTGTAERTVHLMWMEESPGLQVFGHQYSQDGGLTWIQPDGIATTSTIFTQPSFAQDVADGLHFIKIFEVVEGEPELLHRFWDGERWMVSEGYPLSGSTDFSNSILGAAISPQGILGVIFTGDRLDDTSEIPIRELLYSDRIYEVGEALPEPPPLPSAPTAIPTPTVLPTPVPTQTPVVIPLTAEQTPSGIIPLNNSFAGVIVAAFLAIIVVALIFGIYLFTARIWQR
jgi:hypothetical protein